MTTTRTVLTARQLRERLGISDSNQFARVLPELVDFGAFKPRGVLWRMYEDDFDRYLAAKQKEAVVLAERRAK